MPLLIDEADPTDVLRVHAELEVSWEDTVEVTDSPVPLAAPVSLHKERRPRTYSMRLAMSDAPLADLLPFDGQGPPGERWDSMVEAWLDRHLMGRLQYVSPSTGLVTRLELTSVRRGRKGALQETQYDLQFKQTRLARSQTVDLPPARRHRKPNTKPPDEKGPAATKDAPPKLQSADARIYQGVVTGRTDSLRYRALPYNYAVGEATSAEPVIPDAETLTSGYQYSGPYSRFSRGQ